MRSLLVAFPFLGLAAGAFAADLPQGGPAPVMPSSFSWTGIYSGLFLGYGTLEGAIRPACIGFDGRANGSRCPVRPALTPQADDFIAGSEMGYNYQLSPGPGFVVGAAADYQFTPLRSYGTDTQNFSVSGYPNRTFPKGVYHAGQRLDWISTFRGKIGYAFDRILIYGTGGLALGDVRIDTNTTARADRRFPLRYAPNFDSRKGDLRIGYVVGGGIEYAVTPHLSVKGEVLYFDLGDKTLLSLDASRYVPGIVAGARAETNGMLGRIGINYRFDDDGLPIIGPVAQAVTALRDATPYQPMLAQVWDFEIGARYFYGSGNFRKTLADDLNPALVNSRLTYRDFTSHSGETFARLDHTPTGLFAKGFLGSGLVTTGGRLNDEDFPRIFQPYSNTVSKIKNGAISFSAIDLGYNFLQGENYKLGAFAGYQSYEERANAYGLFETATNTTVAGHVPYSNVTLTQDNHWNALRVGLAGETRYERFKLSLEGAYLSVADLNGYDRHWLRPDINPLSERGLGDGYFLQGIVSYDLTPRVSLGIGGRYMTMSVDRRDGSTRFPYASAISQLGLRTDRYGAFAQFSYRLGDPGF